MSLPLMVHDEQWRDRFNESERDGLIEIATSIREGSSSSPRTLPHRVASGVFAAITLRSKRLNRPRLLRWELRRIRP
jgi:hypothetical protein